MARTAAIALKEHKDACKKILKDIKTELKSLTKTKNPDWGDVGTLAEVSHQLASVIESVTGRNTDEILKSAGVTDPALEGV